MPWRIKVWVWPAADLHDDPGAGRPRPDPAQEDPCQLRVPVFGKVLQGTSPSRTPSSPISSRSLKVRWASSASTMEMAKPTWTMT